MVLVDCHMPKVGLYSAFSLKKLQWTGHTGTARTRMFMQQFCP